jgi:pimeloyl-ACP methyl ester carboxylesterase
LAQLSTASTALWQPPRSPRTPASTYGLTDFRADLPKIDIPVLLLHGDADRIPPYPNTAARLPGLIKDLTARAAGRGAVEPAARADGRLREDLAQEALDRARADEQPGVSGFERPRGLQTRR